MTGGWGGPGEPGRAGRDFRAAGAVRADAQSPGDHAVAGPQGAGAKWCQERWLGD